MIVSGQPSIRQRASSILKQQNVYRWQPVCCCGSVLTPADAQRQLAAHRILAAFSDRAAGYTTKSTDARLLKAIHFDQRRHQAPEGWKALERQFRRQRDVLKPAAFILDRALAKQRIAIPDVENAEACRCSLTVQPFGRRFRDKTVTAFLAQLFKAIASSPLSNVSLSRFDLFHGHLFVTRHRPKSLGVLFHAMEYPALEPHFDINLGFCQCGSPLPFSQKAFDCRNWLFFEDQLLCLDVGENSLLHDELLMDGLQPVRTVLEADFGHPLADVNYFDSLPYKSPSDRLFVCLYGI